MFFEYIKNAIAPCIVVLAGDSLYSESKLSERKLHREKEMIQQKERERVSERDGFGVWGEMAGCW